MNMFKKNAHIQEVRDEPKGEVVAPLKNGFAIQTNRITKREESYLRIKGAFKIKVQNHGDVDIEIFGNYKIPSYSEETFDTGDASLGFTSDTLISYAPETVNENINIVLTTYSKK